jgi:hypothetical protein
MWSRLQHWRSWIPRKAFQTLRTLGQPRIKETHISYQHAGLTVSNEPVPWNAETVRVEILIQRPSADSWRKDDFCLAIPGAAPVVAESLRPEGPGAFRLVFEFPSPPLEAAAKERRSEGGISLELGLWGQGHDLGDMELPMLSSEDFLRGLRLEPVSVLARLGQELVPCRAVVGTQCRGLQACGLLTSPTSLVPLLDLGATIEFLEPHTGRVQDIALSLPRSELAGRHALLSAAPRGWPGPGEEWLVRWIVAGHCLAERSIRSLSWKEFWQSLGLIDARYACVRESGPLALTPYLPAREGLWRVGACFRLASQEPGAVGFCALELRTVFKDPTRPSEIFTQNLLITDGPSSFQSPLLSTEDFEQVAAFDLLSEGVPFASLPGCRPVVQFTTEGGFTEPAAFDWTPVAEQELADRLEKLEGVPELGMMPGSSTVG